MVLKREEHRDRGEENEMEISHQILHFCLSFDENLDGGSTAFFSGDELRMVDVELNAGRVFIFHQRSPLHSESEIVGGAKFTLRADVMYETMLNWG